MATIGGIVVATGGAPTTGRRTLLEVIDELARPINGADPTIRGLARDAFRTTVNRMNQKGCWPWEVQEEDVSITANVFFSTVSGSIKKPLAMHKLSGSAGTRDQRIQYISYDRAMEMNDFNFAADVWGYTIPNLYETGQIRWLPKPNVNDNARFTYYRVTPAPRNETEVIEIPDYVIDAYTAMAWYEFLKRLPSQQRNADLSLARADSRQAFREISAHVNSPGDRVRMVSNYG